MSLPPKISICIPAYNQAAFVERLLISILSQDYRNVEVIISDDSSNEDVKRIAEKYDDQLTLNYYHHKPALKTPANWNFPLDKASGDYYMLVHQDDWFHTTKALSTYINAFQQNPGVGFVFARNTAVTEDGYEIILQGIPSLLHTLERKYNHLLLFNVIGPPSNTMLRRDIDIRYDEEFIWLVDVDYYVRMLKKGKKPFYLDAHLVSIGLHQDQATNFCHSHPEIIIKENMLYANKFDRSIFKDIQIYDYYWRFLRNYRIKSERDIIITGVLPERISPVIIAMLKWERNIPMWMLKIGVCSKILMLMNYLFVGRRYYR
jgi:glycosyltransferase involved in cell wall biosynthesis